MTRREFTIKISQLILIMVQEGERPIYDFMLRSAEEQKRLFDKGLSKCDGTEKISNHQKGIAADIYLVNDDGSVNYEWDKEKAIYWHKSWEKMRGKPMIVFSDGTLDKPHFEGG